MSRARFWIREAAAGLVVLDDVAKLDDGSRGGASGRFRHDGARAARSSASSGPAGSVVLPGAIARAGSPWKSEPPVHQQAERRGELHVARTLGRRRDRSETPRARRGRRRGAPRSAASMRVRPGCASEAMPPRGVNDRRSPTRARRPARGTNAGPSATEPRRRTPRRSSATWPAAIIARATCGRPIDASRDRAAPRQASARRRSGMPSSASRAAICLHARDARGRAALTRNSLQRRDRRDR